MRTITAADLFCGAGGTSTGLARACKKMGINLNLLAVNHWDIAISTHTKNHPDARHMCAPIDKIKPLEAFPDGRLNLLVASPECTHFSNARGAKPMTDQRRATAWDILHWLEKLYVDNVLIENVKEFRTWGPLGVNGRPLKSKRGETYQAFLRAIESLGYRVEERVLNAANYGDPTTRERLFIIARRGNKKITWPEPTHASVASGDLFGKQQKWRAAREIIDWSIEGRSIFNRKKPLAATTLKRIEAGLRKFGGPNAEPFIVMLRNHAEARSIDEPLPTVVAGGTHHGLVESFIVPQGRWNPARDLDRPLDTITTTSRGIALVEPVIIAIDHGSSDGTPTPVDQPLRTVTTKERLGVVEPVVITLSHMGEGMEGHHRRCYTVDGPLPTITGKGQFAVVEPFIARACHGDHDMGSWPVDEPLRTLTTKEQFALVEPHLIQYNGQSLAHSVDNPVPTIMAQGEKLALIEPVVEGQYMLDIRFRMLQPHELSAAMGFPEGYEFTGNREAVVKQIGNAVPTNLAEALCMQLLKAA